MVVINNTVEATNKPAVMMNNSGMNDTTVVENNTVVGMKNTMWDEQYSCKVLSIV